MNVRRTLLAALITLTAFLFIGCAGAETEVAEPAAATGGGMGMGAAGATADDPSTGLIASRRFSALQAPRTSSNEDGVIVPAVKAPSDGWLVVRSTLPSGTVLGYAPIEKGLNRNVLVPLTAVDSTRVRVAVHADRGAKGVFEFDPQRPGRSFDRAVFVDEKPLQAEVQLRGFGEEARPHEIELWVENQSASGGSLRIRQAIVPESAWLLVSSVESGRPGRVLAVQGISGESMEIDVPVPSSGLTDELDVTLIYDGGEKGDFGFDPGDPLGSTDQPYTVGGKVITKRIRVE